MACPVNSYKDNLQLLQEHQQTCIKSLIGTGDCSRHWNTVTSMADRTPAFREPAREGQDDKKDKEGKGILLSKINSCEVFYEHQNVPYVQIPLGTSIYKFKSH